MSDTLVIRRAQPGDEDAVLRAHQATRLDVPTFLHHYQDGMPFRRYLELLDDQERGVNLPPDRVPSTWLFAFDGAQVVGRATIRHRLNESLARVGGHIGYAVVPEFRRRGYATRILRHALDVARDGLGLDRVLLTCDDGNIGSIRVIERNGGTLENIVATPRSAVPTRRYWIDTHRPA